MHSAILIAFRPMLEQFKQPFARCLARSHCGFPGRCWYSVKDKDRPGGSFTGIEQNTEPICEQYVSGLNFPKVSASQIR